MITVERTTVSLREDGQVEAVYVPEIDQASYRGSVRILLDDTTAGDVTVLLEIPAVRYLAEILPDLLMAHDAADHALAEQRAASHFPAV
ncbi:hypothetical protein ACFWM1_28475 [Nocardia sp. NPDC058379]|uniref:hypothetical protein n=1 Tax=unclassified Nocardia TaxID=2637762 RepID=UPI00364F4763